MDKLGLAVQLLFRACDEKERLERMETEIAKIKAGPDYWSDRYKIEEKYTPLPRKAVVNDCIKMARRLLVESYL